MNRPDRVWRASLVAALGIAVAACSDITPDLQREAFQSAVDAALRARIVRIGDARLIARDLVHIDVGSQATLSPCPLSLEELQRRPGLCTAVAGAGPAARPPHRFGRPSAVVRFGSETWADPAARSDLRAALRDGTKVCLAAKANAANGPASARDIGCGGRRPPTFEVWAVLSPAVHETCRLGPPAAGAPARFLRATAAAPACSTAERPLVHVL